MSRNFFIRLKVKITAFIIKPFFLKRWKKYEQKNPGLYKKLKELQGTNNEEQLHAYNEICKNLK